MMVGTGDTASTATTAVVSEEAKRSNSIASELRRFAAANAMKRITGELTTDTAEGPTGADRPATCADRRQKW